MALLRREARDMWMDRCEHVLRVTTNEGENQLVKTATSMLTNHGWRVTQQTNAGSPYLTGRKFLDKTIPLKVNSFT
ncbi:MAG: hypothetical protein M0Z39_08880 [Actinomycetota bacterium]|nr:hypothetical protein [Actinomycetota bacterium]